MRRPFIIFLFALIFFFWLKDCAEFVFYVCGNNGSNINIYCSVIALIVFIASFFFVKKTVFKNKAFPTLKEIFQPERKKEWLLLFLISLPLILFGLFRCIYPDLSYDTGHYEIYLQDFRFSENKTNFGVGAIRTYFFPLSERVFGFSRHLLGYRLGTILTTFLLVVIIFSSYDFIKRFLSEYAPVNKLEFILPAFLSLYIIFADNTLLILSSYKTDLLGIPFLQELLYMLFFGGRSSKRVNFFIFYIITSLVVSLKLTYLPYAVILGLAYYIKNYKQLPLLTLFFIPFIVLLFPSIYMLYNFIETGNPVYPVYNKIFHSPLYPIENYIDPRWGPKNLKETLFYHIITWQDNTRCNEWSLFSYRLLFGSFISFACILYYLFSLIKKRNNPFFRQIALLSLISILADYACTVSTGYYRYGIIIEVFYGLVMATLLIYLKKNIINLFIAFAILFQCAVTYKNICKKQLNQCWADYPGLLGNKEKRNDNISRMLHDYGASLDNNETMPKIDAFVSIYECMLDGWAKLLNNKAPIYNLSPGRPADSISKLEKNVIRVQSQNNNIMLLSGVEHIRANAINVINLKGYMATDMYEIHPNFLRAKEPIFLFKIKYLDTSRYSIKSISQEINLEASTDTSGSKFSYHSDKKLRIYIRETPYYFDHPPIETYDLFINDKKYTITGESKYKPIYTLETNNLTIRASRQIAYIVIIQEIEEKTKTGN